MVFDYVLTPLSTIFQLYRGGWTLRNKHVSQIYIDLNMCFKELWYTKFGRPEIFVFCYYFSLETRKKMYLGNVCFFIFVHADKYDRALRTAECPGGVKCFVDRRYT